MKLRLLVAACALFVVSCYAFHLNIFENPQWRSTEGRSTEGVEARWANIPITWSFLCGEQDVPEFRDGFKWWNDRYGKVIFAEVSQEQTCLCGAFDGGPCPDVLVLRGLEEDDLAVLKDAGIDVKSYARTWMYVDAGVVNRAVVRYYDIFEDASETARMTVTRHEIGHVLGLMHSGKSSCLMYPTVNIDDPTTKDICSGEDGLVRDVYQEVLR